MMKYSPSQDLPLLEALALLSPQSSKTTLRSWVKEERVLVEGFLVKVTNHVVLAGQSIEVIPRKKLIPGGIQIIHEDSDFVVIHKPMGLLSVSTAFEKGETAHALLKDYYKTRRVQVVHRLDQETSGVMVFALSDKGFNAFKEIFEKHDIERGYTAIVEGYVSSKKGTWRSYLLEDEQYRVRVVSEQEGRLAVTHYQTEKATKRYSWLTLRLETGRKNQIRVHCTEAGHPVVGDKKYGAHSNPVKRLCLHAHLLAFIHPFTGKPMRFESPIPTEFYKLLQQLPPPAKR